MAPDGFAIGGGERAFAEEIFMQKQATQQPENSPPEMTREEALQRLFRNVTNVSRAKRVARQLFGPASAVWRQDGLIAVGTQRPGSGAKEVYGRGSTFQEAFVDACRDLSTNEVRGAVPELRALSSIDVRSRK